MRRRCPDRVPVFCQLALGHYFLQAGLPARSIWFTSEGFAGALVRLQRRYAFDGILVNLPGRPPALFDDLLRAEAQGASEQLTWRNGQVTLMPPDDNPQHFAAGGVALERADFQQLDPDRLERLGAVGGYIWNIYHIQRLEDERCPGLGGEVPDYFHRTIDLVRSATGGSVSVHGEVFSPFTHFMELFGYQEALMGLALDPGRAIAFLGRLTDSSIAWGVAQARRGVDAVLVSSAFAGSGFLSRRMYEQFVLPAERRLHRAIQATGVPTYTHTCGQIGDRLDLMLATETQGLDTLDPPPLGDVELAAAKARLGNRAFIKGNLNPVAFWQCREADEVLALARSCLRDGQPGGGYILSTACSVPPRVEPWKLELLTPLAEAEGRYAPASRPECGA